MTSTATTPPATRSLVLLRHGKSAYPPGVSDHDRPLAPRGSREAALAGAWIGANLPAVEHIVCSTALRARQTLDASGLATGAVATEFTSAIYEAYPEELLEIVAALRASFSTVLLVGHAPGIPELAEELAGPDSDRAALNALEAKFPTSAIAVFTVGGDWAALAEGSATLAQFVVPRA
jgi:phosphohistidine phosphatase